MTLCHHCCMPCRSFNPLEFRRASPDKDSRCLHTTGLTIPAALSDPSPSVHLSPLPFTIRWINVGQLAPTSGSQRSPSCLRKAARGQADPIDPRRARGSVPTPAGRQIPAESGSGSAAVAGEGPAAAGWLRTSVGWPGTDVGR